MYRTAIEQCAWGEGHGFSAVHLSEHHGAPDGYCPAPLLLASAVAARTETLMIYITALIAPLHNPVRLAEQVAVLDIISGGRVLPVLGAGYREEEFAAIGKTLDSRRDYMEMIGPFLERAWSGEPFEFEGREITVTPRPHSRPRPPLLMGGSSRAAARRAARNADFFAPSGPEIFEMYREELAKLGKPDPGPMPASSTETVFVAEDPRRLLGADSPAPATRDQHVRRLGGADRHPHPLPPAARPCRTCARAPTTACSPRTRWWRTARAWTTTPR